MAKFDLDEVTKLLNIPVLVANTAPGLMHIAAEAMARLREINNGLEAAAVKARKPDIVPGQPVHNPAPSVPVDEPSSDVAKPEYVKDLEVQKYVEPAADLFTNKPEPDKPEPRRP